jgi:hypothetical protein
MLRNIVFQNSGIPELCWLTYKPISFLGDPLSVLSIPGALSLGVERPWHEADYSPPSSAEVRKWVELYLYSPSTPLWRGAQLKHRDNFTFTLADTFHYFKFESLSQEFLWGIYMKTWEKTIVN